VEYHPSDGDFEVSITVVSLDRTPLNGACIDDCALKGDAAYDALSKCRVGNPRESAPTYLLSSLTRLDRGLGRGVRYVCLETGRDDSELQHERGESRKEVGRLFEAQRKGLPAG